MRTIAAILSFGWMIGLGAGVAAQTSGRVAELRPCSLPSGANIEVCRIGYRTFGQKRGNNAVLVPTWLGGTSSDWRGLLGPDRLIDTTVYYVMVIDALGNGISSSPSNTSGFPQVSIEDMVETQYRLAREALRIDHLRAVVGVSMGGIQTFEWSVAHPDFVDRFVSIVGSPQMARHDRAWLQTMVRLFGIGETYHVPQDSVWRMFAGVGLLIQDVQETINQRSPAEADSLLAAAATEWSKTLKPDDFVLQARAILAYHFYGRPGSDSPAITDRLRGRFMVVNSPDDRLVSAGPALSIARRLGLDTLVVRSPCGHAVFACEAHAIGASIGSFLAR